MVIPDRGTLLHIVDKLKDAKINENSPDDYAKLLLSTVSPLSRSLANESVQFLRDAPVNTIIEHCGQTAPEPDRLTLIKLSLEKLYRALTDGKLTLPPRDVNAVKEILEQMDSYSFQSNPSAQRQPQQPTMITPPSVAQLSRKNTPVPLDDPMIAMTPRTASRLQVAGTPLPVSSRRERSAESMQNLGHQEIYNTEQIFASKQATKAQEFMYYSFASIALGVVVFFILDSFYQGLSLFVRVVISSSIPILFMATYAILRTLQVLKYIRIVFSVMFATLILYLGAFYGYKTYEAYQARAKHSLVFERGESIGRALDAYNRDNGRYPVALQQLYAPRNYLRPSEGDGSVLFTDPFRPESELLYQRYVSGWILKSVGPQQQELTVDWPNDFDQIFWEEFTAASYDPTNGARSPGNIIVLPQRLMQLRGMSGRTRSTQPSESASE